MDHTVEPCPMEAHEKGENNMLINICISLFIILELANVLTLYFNPDTKLFNGMGAFKAWDRIKDDDRYGDFVRYLVNWIAGAKLIFIALLIVILCFGSHQVKVISCAAMILSIASFFWRLFPLIKKIDLNGMIDPPNYHKTLAIMILSIMGLFVTAFVIGVL
jgi:hypothetical protein